MSNFYDNWSIFTWFTAQINIKTDRQTNLKISDSNIFNNGTTEKGRSLKKKNMIIGALFKNYRWTKVKKYIYTDEWYNFPSFQSRLKINLKHKFTHRKELQKTYKYTNYNKTCIIYI